MAKSIFSICIQSKKIDMQVITNSKGQLEIKWSIWERIKRFFYHSGGGSVQDMGFPSKWHYQRHYYIFGYHVLTSKWIGKENE